LIRAFAFIAIFVVTMGSHGRADEFREGLRFGRGTAVAGPNRAQDSEIRRFSAPIEGAASLENALGCVPGYFVKRITSGPHVKARIRWRIGTAA
jgi:hypothetical protein